MKCVKYSDGAIRRLSDEEAFSIVREGKAVFIPKNVWKTATRSPAKKVVIKKVTPVELSPPPELIPGETTKTTKTAKNKSPKKVKV